jgi:hypothetical protein
MLILVLAANTSFADFPRLASFHAGDNFMPRQLTKRGHRLVFSNGIIALAVSSIVLVIITGARVDHLIPLYAIGVFTSFTLSQGGMAKHHWTKREPGWRVGLFINGTGAVLSLVVDVIIAITKFKPAGEVLGAWVIVLLVPVMVVVLVRLNRQYEAEAEELEHDAPTAAQAPVLANHEVIVLVDALDLASARAVQYARTLSPDSLRAVHFDLDPVITEDLVDAWWRLGFSKLPLEVHECPERRLEQSAAELVAEATADGRTEVTVLIPRRAYTRVWHRLLHDRSADALAEAVARLPHANVTIVPYHLGHRPGEGDEPEARAEANGAVPLGVVVDGATPSSAVHDRVRATVAGRVVALRVQPMASSPTLHVVIADGSGRFTAVFLGRRDIPGIRIGATISVTGMVGLRKGHLAMLNPSYEILVPAVSVASPKGQH